MKTIILVIGPSGSGKTEVAKFIEAHGIPRLGLGDQVREETARRGLPIITENVEATAVQARKEFGQDIFAKRVLEKALSLPNPVVCIEGARDTSEVRYLESHSNFFFVVVKADPNTRFSRITARRNTTDPLVTEKDFEVKEKTNVKLGILEVISYKAPMRFEIQNNGTLEELKAKVGALVAAIMKGAEGKH